MPLKLLKLPQIVQQEIINHMAFDDIFLFSLCSTSIVRIIRNVRFPEQIRRMKVYVRKGGNMVMEVSGYHICSMILASELLYGEVIKTRKTDRAVEFRFQRFSSAIEEISFLNILRYSEPDRNIAPLAIQDHIEYLFRRSFDVKLTIKSSADLPILPAFRNVITCKIDGEKDTVDATVLDQFFSCHPNMKGCRIMPSVTGEINADSNMCKLQNICCDSKIIASNIISTFPGTILVFHQAECNISVFLDLLRKWYNKDAHQNLKIASVRLSDTSRVPADGWQEIDLLQEFNPRPWNEERRPASHIKAEYIRLDKVTSLDPTRFLCIEQKGGGQIGSVYLGRAIFVFNVWP